MILGVAVSTRPITTPSVRFNSLSEKRTINKTGVLKGFSENASQTEPVQVPDWVKDEVIRQVKGTSYISGLESYAAWKSKTKTRQTLNTSPNLRPTPPEPADTGEISVDNNWNNDGRVNNDATNLQFHPASCVGTDGTIYVAWAQEINSSNYWIYFSKSTNGGESWSTAVLVDGYGINNHVGIACYGTGSTADVYITYTYWYDAANYDYDVCCAVSNNGGTSWPYLWYIQNTSYYEEMATVATDNVGYVYIAYVYAWWSSGGCDGSTAESEIYMKRSTDRGASWSSAYALTNYGGQHDDVLPAIATYGGGTTCQLHLAWTHDVTTTGANYDVYYKKITNAGGTPTIPSGYVTISSSSDQEYVIPRGIDVGPNGDPHITYIYSTATNGYGDIRYRRSFNGGTSFNSYQNISARSTEETDPVIAVDDQDNPIIVWRDTRWGNPDIYLKYSDDRGATWRGEYKANQDAGGSDQYWPSLDLKRDGWRRFISVTWWDTRYDAGDVYFNGNSMTGVALDVDYVPTAPPTPMPGFKYYAFETYKDTTFAVPDSYRIWFDDEYVATNNVLLDQIWAGSGSTERWAIPNPGGWSWVAPSYYAPPSSGGAFPCYYHHQFRVIFDAIKRNPAACTHTLPNIELEYTAFSGLVLDTINDVVECTTWIDRSTYYNATGWVDLSPLQRWATIDPDTIGLVIGARRVEIDYFHQWYPLILLVGPTAGNYTFTTQHSQFGSPHVESGLYDSWQQWSDCGAYLEFSDTTNPLGWYAIDSTLFMTLEYFASTIRYSNNASVTVRNDFGFGNINVDYVSVPSPSVNSWGPGTVHNIGAISPQAFGDTVRYTYSHWSDGGAISHNITTPEHDVIFTAFFDTEYKIDMTYTGSTGGHVPTLTGAGWHWKDSFALITASEGWDSTTGIRYGFSHWESVPPGAFFADSASPTTTVLVDKHYTIVAVYSVQYMLQVVSGYGTPNPPVGINWVDVGIYFCAHAGSPDVVEHMYATGWTGTGAVPSSGSGDMACFHMTAPGTITWHWANQLTLDIVSTYGLPTPSVGRHYYNPGDYVECSVPTPFYLTGTIRSACSGYTGTSVIGSGAGSYVDFNIVANCTLTWNWNLQYSLTVNNPSGYGSPVPPTGITWHNAASPVMARVLSPDGAHVCIGFNGVPPALPTTSPQDSIVFNMIAPTSLTWLWAPFSEVVSFTVNDGGLGDASPYGTTYWFPGSPIEAHVTSPWPDPINPGIRWIAEGYTGTGSCPSGSGSSTGTWFIFSNSVLTWNWDEQYRLLIDSEPSYYGAPVPDTGAHFYDPGTWVSGNVTSPWEDSIVCTGFAGTGSAPATGIGTSFGFNLSSPSSVTWQWDISVVELQVRSDYGTPTPPVGNHVYATGSGVTLSVNKHHNISSTERYECVGWTGTGDVPSSGTDTLVNIVINTNSMINWVWRRQFRVDIDNPGGYDTPVPPAGQHWFDAGSWVSCYITTNPVDTMYCVGYFGTGSLGSEYGVDAVNFLLDRYTTLQWVWLGAGSVESLLVVSDYGTPHPPVGRGYYPRGARANCHIIDCTVMLGSNERFRCVGFSGTGPVPSGSDTLVSFDMTSSGTLTWLWQRQYTFEVRNPSGRGAPVPPVGIYWMHADNPVDAFVTVNPDGGWYCVGYDGWGALSEGYGDSVHFVLTSPSGVEWNWMTGVDVTYIDVFSPYGPCNPPIGRNYVPVGAVMVLSAGPHSYIAENNRQSVIGWTGVADVPSIGDSNAVSILVSRPSSITWQWQNEIHLALNYMGCGGAVPVQTGEGWFPVSAHTEITTSTSVEDGGNHYGFMSWIPNIPGAVTIDHETYPNTSVTLVQPCTLMARYGPAVYCVLTKSPLQDFGGFVVDGTLYNGIHTYSDWWAVGTYHDIEATSPDTSGGERYVFDYWTHGGDIAHTVGPITTGTTLVAHYLPQYKLTLVKDPWHTDGHFRINTTTYVDVARVEEWFAPGSAPTISASDIDIVSLNERYLWNSWSDGGAIAHIIEPMAGSVELTAFYNHQYRFVAAKHPPQSLGSITIDGVLNEFVGSVEKWYSPSASPHYLEVSRIDYSGDSAYTFQNFNGVPIDTTMPKSFVISGPDSITAFYDWFAYEINLFINPTIWNNPGFTPADYIKTMIPPEVITATNIGNIPIDMGFGLVMSPALTSWSCGCINGVDRVVIRANVNRDPFPPATFNPVRDCLKETNTWCSDLNFGTHGWYIRPAEAQKIWLQMITPTYTSDLTLQTFVMRVTARVSLY
jgi:hypothetical protein